jgi:rubrerythrin
MDVTFNASEIFEIAEQIERNGTRFYHKAAELFDEHQIRNMFLELVNWETKHQEVFRDMRKQLSHKSRELPTVGSEAGLFTPKAMAGLAVFGIKPDPSEELTGKESIVDVLKKAIIKEKDSIVYYTGLKEFIPTRADRDKIDDIIKEELRHIRILSQSLAQRQ